MQKVRCSKCGGAGEVVSQAQNQYGRLLEVICQRCQRWVTILRPAKAA